MHHYRAVVLDIGPTQNFMEKFSWVVCTKFVKVLPQKCTIILSKCMHHIHTSLPGYNKCVKHAVGCFAVVSAAVVQNLPTYLDQTNSER